MGWARRSNPRIDQIARIKAYLRTNPDVARALYDKRVHDVPLPPGTLTRAIAAVEQGHIVSQGDDYASVPDVDAAPRVILYGHDGTPMVRPIGFKVNRD